jgi:large subunit ribosomal protein L30
MAAKLSVTLRRSLVGVNPSARGTVRALGLRRIGQTVELPDDPAVRGQIRAVRYLIEWEEVSAAPTRKKTASRKKEEAEA